MNCPKCNFKIDRENINIKTDIAQCDKCDYIFKVSENLANYIDDRFDFKNTPNGTWYKKELNDTIIGATTRSPMAFFLVPFMLIWSGGSIGTIYGSQIIKGEFDLSLSLFGIPFLVGSIVFWSFALTSIWGKVELTLNNRGGKIFTGIGNIGLIKRFNWNDVSTLKEKRANYYFPGGQSGRLVFEGKKRISFGLGVKSDRSYYLYRAIRSLIHTNNWK